MALDKSGAQCHTSEGSCAFCSENDNHNENSHYNQKNNSIDNHDNSTNNDAIIRMATY